MLINKFNYPTCSRENQSGSRVYNTPDGAKLPSVTTILEATKSAEKRQSLMDWRKRIGEANAQAITTESASRGTRMHSYLEQYIKGDELKEVVTNPYAQQSLIMAKTVIKQGFNKINEVWGNEVSLYYPNLYAGTTDCVGIHEGMESILDFKQTNKPKKIEYIDDYFLQLVSYALAHNQLFDTNIRRGVILMCVKPEEISSGIWAEPQYQEFIVDGPDFDYWTQRWWDRVTQYYEKKLNTAIN